QVELNNITPMNPKDKIPLNSNLTPLNLVDEIPLNSNITSLNLKDGTPNPENEVINLCVSCVFESWESVDTIMEAYGKKYGFVIIKKRLIHHENGSIKHRSFGCEFVLTTFNNSHNYTLFPNTEEYSTKYQCVFDNDVLKEIQFLIEHGNLSITIQRKLLKAKFLTLYIFDYDLVNAIQKYKFKAKVIYDVSCLLKKLIQH
ncbi:12685_t:CDS:2, partial [Funneliformis geosporum]